MLKKIFIPCVLAYLAVQACAPSDTAPVEKSGPVPALELQWNLTGLDSPESVIPSADGKELWVSNVNGEGDAKDGNGYIARLSLSGDLVEKDWITGLNGPKGLSRAGTTLYVSDIDHLVEIDTLKGEVTARIPMPGAGFLNDVLVTDAGVLVSDSANARIYAYHDGKVSIWREDGALSGINGLYPYEDNLLITTMDKGSLLALDWRDKSLKEISTGMKNADGITPLKDGTFLTSSWPGKLYHVGKDGTQTVLLDTEAEEIYLNDMYLWDDTLYIPNWQPGSVRAYTVK
jgi:hypothetical protein